jgi:hypothetical protein
MLKFCVLSRFHVGTSASNNIYNIYEAEDWVYPIVGRAFGLDKKQDPGHLSVRMLCGEL